jgi:acetoin utilization deacetylase AcuC-like enzyme
MRATHVYKALLQQNLIQSSSVLQPEPIDEIHLSLAHDPKYLAQAKRDIEEGLKTLTTGDTSVSQDSWSVALRASGSACLAVKEVFSGKLTRAFCASRPPGHHATAAKGMGFCIFNHVALAARYAQKKYGVGKVLIVDWDVHHGNGTQDIFYEDETVFFMSSHQSPWYPGTGAKFETGTGKGLGSTLNFPLPAGSGRKEIVEDAFGNELQKRMNTFRPELILISAGFDSRQGDPLGQFTLEDQDFANLTEIICDLAGEFCQGKVISILEGGYDFGGLAKAANAHFKALSTF